MDGGCLKREEVLQEIRSAWAEHPQWAKDERWRWGLALARVRSVLLKHKNRQRQNELEAAEIHRRLAMARMLVQEDPSETNKDRFEMSLQAARQREQADTRISRMKCRIKWLEDGDASSRYFFACLKAKNKRENITTIKLDTGEVVTDDGRILQLIEATYGGLYSAEMEGTEVREQRREILQLVDKTLTREQNRTLAELPSNDFIQEIVRSLPHEKSPGFDGVTVEVLLAGWEFMSNDCYHMVQKVWKSSMLLSKDNRGIIKLIPKADALFLLKNWRPITLLTTTYKIIAKIFACRLKPMLPDIIDQQQTGFISGRSIVENILSLRMTQEWVPATGQEIMFIKLDFQKAYNRVSHSYLWETLAALGLSPENVQRIKGLVTGGAAQVHVNGSFTKRFEVTHGVRQGCPLAPLLFAMVTQPLMRLLREEEVFEEISGAKLNLAKSLIMPICPTVPSGWLNSTGCEVAGPSKHFLYLGVSTSNPINEVQITKAISQKIMKRLAHCSKRFLSWPAKIAIVLLKQVLAATPLYQNLSVGMEQTGVEG
ncbi:hypothetical protein R1sor_000686 [Riccia sorocarpa]|uniref:Reverse transcriptase domain-containing protein n=1 Tax=Riccia sorocarpa TaxID=122646 RepID=A0ABD3GWB4_9MARC